MITSQMIEEKIQGSIPNAQVKARDLTGGGDHWTVEVRSAAFAGLGLVEQHQLVYKALGRWMEKEIHALAIDTKSL